MMVKQQYTVSFVTPAFLGDAEQNGAWRTPPFKALLRKWWRVAAAKDYGYNHERLREMEGQLFGNAWIENNFSKSQVRLRLDQWGEGKLKKATWLGKDEKVDHPEVTNKKGEAMPVGAELYLGYGPLNYDNIQRKTVLKANAAIQESDSVELRLAYPNSQAMLADVMQLIDWFGTVGGRSRNGWGSLLLEGNKLRGLGSLKQTDPLLNELARPLDQCLGCTWPHAIGKDKGRLLIWTSKKPHETWREAMVELAKTKIEFRTNLIFIKSKGKLDQRHVLAYPVTNHSVNEWEKYKVAWSSGTRNGRLANQLRFKVTKNAEGKYIGLVYHLPCGIPHELLNVLGAADRTWIVGQQLDVWRSVHGILDKKMQRI